MPRLLLCLGQVAMLLVLFAAGGGHWMALQSFAWTRMILSYSNRVPLVEAMARTFDGRHPCDLCKKVSESRKNEPAPQSIPHEDHAIFLVPPSVAVLIEKRVSWELEVPQAKLSGREDQPAIPPPRGGAV